MRRCTSFLKAARLCSRSPQSILIDYNYYQRNQRLFLTGASQNVEILQSRCYTPPAVTAIAESECWNCKKSTQKRENMICTACGYLQDVNADINYFDLLQCPADFVLEQQLLTKSFRQLQTLVHPDKFSNKTSREQVNSAEWSSLINKAYKTLLAPITRGQYLLQLKGEDIPQDNSALNAAFLMDMMERNEEVENATSSEDLAKLNMQIVQEVDEKVLVLAQHFANQNLEGAKAVLVEMKYLLNIQSSIKQKAQGLLD